jgi:hypothetical protein
MKPEIVQLLTKIVTSLGILLGIVLSILLLSGIGISAYIVFQWNDSSTAEINQNWIVDFTKLPDEENRYMQDRALKNNLMNYIFSLEQSPEWKEINAQQKYTNAEQYIMYLLKSEHWREYNKFLSLSKEERNKIKDLTTAFSPEIKKYNASLHQKTQDPDLYTLVSTGKNPSYLTRTPFIVILYQFITLHNITNQNWKEAKQNIEFLFLYSNVPTTHPSISDMEFFTIKESTHNLLQIYLQKVPYLSEEEIRYWINLLDTSQKNTAEYTQNTIKETYTTYIHSIQNKNIVPEENTLWVKHLLPFYFQRNRTITLITQHLPPQEYFNQSCIERKKVTEEKERIFEQIAGESLIKNTIKDILQRNKLGKEYVQSILHTGIISPIGTQCYLETNTNLTKTMLLLKHYKQTHGEYPSSLDAIENNAFFPLPLDYFSFGDTSFKYDPHTLTLSSIKGSRSTQYNTQRLIIDLEPQK